MPEYHYKFDTIDDLIKAKELPYVNPINAENGYAKYEGDARDPYWIRPDRAVYSHADMKRLLAEQTYPDGVALIEKLSAGLAMPTPVSRRRRPVRASEGDELDMQRVWQGDLEHAWRRTKREQSVGPSRVLVAVNVCASAYITAEDLGRRGAVALAYSNALLEAGYTVQLEAAASTTLYDGHDSLYTLEASLMEAGGNLDLHKLASLVGCGLLFRGVSLDHQLRVSKHRVEAGIGRALPLDVKHLDTNGYDYVAVVQDANSQSEANAWLKQNIEALSVREAA